MKILSLLFRTVYEPILKNLVRNFFGHIILNLLIRLVVLIWKYNRNWFLPKTLLYVEGLGRQAYPQLDLWKTAKPFLEDWLHSQISGITALKMVPK